MKFDSTAFETDEDFLRYLNGLPTVKRENNNNVKYSA